MLLPLPQEYLSLFRTISVTAGKMNLNCYVVGGFVRDILLNRPCKDLDFVVEGDGLAIATEVSEALGIQGKVSVFKKFGTAMFRFRDWEIEFVGARKESYIPESRKPEVEPGTFYDDQLRRDFTINTLAASLQEKDFLTITDSFNGMEHLKQKKIVTPQEPALTFSDDPLRMMRCIRFATQLDFTIDENCFNAIKVNAERINIISMERVHDEINKIMSAPVPSKGFKLLFDSGLLQLIFPQLTRLQGTETINGLSHKDNFYHTLEVLDNLSQKSDDLWLRWAALLHDIAKPATKRFDEQNGWSFHGHEDKGARMVPGIFAHFKLPLNEKMKFVQKLVLLHLRPIVLAKEGITDSAVRRLIVEAGEDMEALLLLCEADITTKNPFKIKKYLENFQLVKEKIKEVEEKDHLRNWQPVITGDIIIKTFALRPGPEIGNIKNAVREAILEGTIANNFEEAFRFMLEEGARLGLHPVMPAD